MNQGRDELERCILQVLYENYSSIKRIPVDRLAFALGQDEAAVVAFLGELVEKEFVFGDDEGYKLTDAGYSAIYQRETSYCPHL